MMLLEELVQKVLQRWYSLNNARVPWFITHIDEVVDNGRNPTFTLISPTEVECLGALKKKEWIEGKDILTK